MKQLKQFALTVLVALVGSLSANAHDFEAVNEGSTIYYTITSSKDLTCAVSFRGNDRLEYSHEYSGSVVIPSSVEYNGKTYSVTSIGSEAFRGCSDLTSINIPNSVTSIGYAAFRSCSGLTSINIPNSVTSIGSYAFESCTSLPVENGIRYADTYAVEAIDKTQFFYTIKEGTRFIGTEAFFHCSSLISINIPNSVTSIGGWAFDNCSSLTSISIPNSVTSIGSSAFSGCIGLTSITIPNSVTSIGSSAFHNCSGLTSINIPNSVTSIGSYAFRGCSGLTSINIPNSVTSIGNSAFSGCSGLTSITIPNSVTEIGDWAFQDCSGLTSINIPNSVTSIGSSAFYGCSGLTSITIPNSVTSISSYAFYGCSGLTSINIPNSVTSIGESAFYRCSKLSEVHISEISSWMKINFSFGSPFEYKYDLYVNGLKLTNLVVPKDIKSVLSYSFYNYKSLETIILHDEINAIAQNAFNGCSNVKMIYCLGVTPPACGTKALEGISRSECTLYVPEKSTAYPTTAPWSEFTNIVGGTVVVPETPETCAAPEIALENGELVITSETPGSRCIYSIRPNDFLDGETESGASVELSGVYTITAYATAEGMYNSETVTMLLYWSKPSFDGEAEMTLVGDLNGDGKVNIADLNLVIDIMSER